MSDRSSSVLAVKESGKALISGLEPKERKKIEGELQQLDKRWEALTKRVADRAAMLEEVHGLAHEFQDIVDPLTTWLDSSDKQFAALEPQSPEAYEIERLIEELQVIDLYTE